MWSSNNLLDNRVLITNKIYIKLMLFTTETASLGQPCLSTCSGTEDCEATFAGDGTLRVGKDCGNYVATRALNIHEITVGVLHQPFQFMGTTLLLSRGVQQINCERHL